MSSPTPLRKAAVLRPSDMPRIDRGSGASSTPLVGPSCGASSFINGIMSFAPGTQFPFHSHNCEESFVLLEGEAILDVEGQASIPLQPMDTTLLPPGLAHRLRNTSDTQPMKIFWMYARTDATRTVTETGKTNFISADYSKK